MTRAWCELDLEAVRRNARTIRTTAGGALTAVVKADGYGHGAALVGRAAVEGGADALAVATPAEARALRDAGVAAPVQVLGSFLEDELDDALAARASLTIHEAADLLRLRRAAARAGRPLDVHLKVDVGMHRHGVPPGDALEVLAAAAADPALRVVGLMTHLPEAACADLERSAAQVDVFAGLVRRAAAAGLRPPRVHAAASAALFRLPASRFDAVRSGIALVGLDPRGRIAATGAGLAPALAVHTRVMRLQRAAAGDRVGYGGRWTAPRDSVLAILGVGYGDGIPYTLSGRGAAVLIDGRRCPLAGTVMMDYLLADVTDLPRPPAPGAVATFAGAQGTARVSLDEQAERAGMIPYALATTLGGRIARRVVDSAAEAARAA